MLVKRFFLVLFLCFTWCVPTAFCQEEEPVKSNHTSNDSTDWMNRDTVNIKSKKHSPARATLYSLALPGLGQAYNRQYWKIPIIYGVGAFFINQIATNDYDYTQADRIVKERQKNELLPHYKEPKLFKGTYDYYDPYDTIPKSSDRRLATDRITAIRDGYRRDRDFYVIMSALLYTLNIIDATVFAHLREFEVSDKLTMKIDPQIKFMSSNAQLFTGISCSLHFK